MSLKRLAEESYNKEAMLVGMLWNNPELFDSYSSEKLNKSTLANKVWKFYLGLGRYLYEEKHIKIFDDIMTMSVIKELGLEDKYEKYGDFETIELLMEETKGKEMNFDGIYDEVKKYALLRGYHKLFGDKVIEQKEGYNYKSMPREAISMYWNDMINEIDIEHNDSQIQTYNLLEGLDEYVNLMDEEPDIGMPFHHGKKMTDMINGWAFGTVSILGAFSGNGKSSITVEKIVMSCIQEDEKLAIIANEMDVDQYRKLLLITVMGGELYYKFKDEFSNPRFSRKNINRGNFTPEEKKKLKYAVEWVKDKIQGKESLIKLIPLEDYTMDNVEKVMRKYRKRGFRRWIVDTAKPSESGNKERWQQFVDDFDRLYKISRKDAGGLDIATFTTIQLADHYVGRYWLNEQAIADGKKIKNVVDLVWMLRPIFPTEYEGADKELRVYQWIPFGQDEFNEDENYEGNDDEEVVEMGDSTKLIKRRVRLKHGKVYYALFTPKNRRGQSNLTGLDVLILSVDFNSNRWTEVGYCNNIFRDDI